MKTTTFPTVSASDWLEVDAIPPNLTIAEIIKRVQVKAEERWPGRRIGCALANRWQGYDPRPDLDADYGVIEVHCWKTIVDRVSDDALEIAIGDVPALVRVNRKLGHPWYETIAHVILPGSNLEARPPSERGLDTLPIRKR